MARVKIFIVFCILFWRLTAAGYETSAVVSFQVVGGHAHCPRDAGKKEFLLGWGDRPCAQLSTIGPQLLTNSSSLDFRAWDLEVVSHRTVRLVTHIPAQGSMLCSGSLAVANPQSCQDDKVTIATFTVTDSSDEFVMVPVPKSVRTSTEELYLVAKGRTKGCARFLSALQGCHHDFLKLATTDDGSGLQRWIRHKVATVPTPSASPQPNASPSPLPSPSSSPRPAAPAPFLSAYAIGPTELMVNLGAPQTGCSVVKYVLTYYSANQQPQSVVIQPESGPEVYHILSGLQPNTSYTLQATAACSAGTTSSASPLVMSETLPNCLGRGERCSVSLASKACCEGTCISAGGSVGVCGYAQSLPTVIISFTVDNFTGSIVNFQSQIQLYFSKILQLSLSQVEVIVTVSNSRRLLQTTSLNVQAQIRSLQPKDASAVLRSVATNGSLSSEISKATKGASLNAGSINVVNSIAPSPPPFPPPSPPSPPPPPPAPPQISTFAGNGTYFYGDGGPATSAALQAAYAFPYALPSMALDSSGNLYFSDPINERVRKIDLNSGIISTIAGDGVSQSDGDGGAATSASLNVPTGVTLDSSGNLYVATELGGRVRQISKMNISTYAKFGSGFPPLGPAGIAFDSSGNLYTALSFANVVVKTDSKLGNTSVFAGNGSGGYSGDGGPASGAQLGFPSGLFIDSSGNVYITDTGTNRIRKVDTASANISTVAGNGTAAFGGDGGPATSAALIVPVGRIFEFMGNIYIPDTGNNRIRKIDKSGNISTVVGNGTQGYFGDGGAAISAGLSFPSGVLFDSSGNMYISDFGNSRIRKVDNTTGNIVTVAGNGSPMYAGGTFPATSVGLSMPVSIRFDALGNAYIADFQLNYVLKVNASSGNLSVIAGNGTAGFGGDGGRATSAALYYPGDAFPDLSGNLFISDARNNRIRKVDAVSGNISTVAGNGSSGYSGDGGPATSAELNYPTRLFVDSFGNIYIADAFNNRIRKVDAVSRNISTVAGNGSSGYSGDGGPATRAELRIPNAVFVDSSGNIYFADAYNNRTRKVDAVSGNISTVAGNGSSGYSGDGGPATNAELYVPLGLYMDSTGNLIISDSGNNAVRRVDAASGNISTVAGVRNTGTLICFQSLFFGYAQCNAGYNGDGIATTAASLSLPLGVTMDSWGHLFIADSNNHRIRKVAPPV